jgi:hypothetical protein
MPNWCENEIEIHGPNDEMERFIDLFFTMRKDDGLWIDFYKVAPLDMGEDQNGDPKWDYDTASEKWGTKWAPEQKNAWEIHTSDNFTNLTGCFDTAWDAPRGIYDLMQNWIDENDSEIYIDWFYKEPNMRFAGWLGDD